jgi:hypothetical protein
MYLSVSTSKDSLKGRFHYCYGTRLLLILEMRDLDFLDAFCKTSNIPTR